MNTSPLLLFPSHLKGSFCLTVCDTRRFSLYLAKVTSTTINQPCVWSRWYRRWQVNEKNGVVEFPLRISEWHGMVEATVLDLQVDFGTVLGLDWNRQWRPFRTGISWSS